MVKLFWENPLELFKIKCGQKIMYTFAVWYMIVKVYIIFRPHFTLQRFPINL